MERLKHFLKRVFCLPPLLTVLLAVPAFALMIYVLAERINGPLAYFSYAVSAYALTIVLTGTFHIVRSVRRMIKRHPMGRRLTEDIKFRAELSLYVGFAINLLYIVLKMASGGEKVRVLLSRMMIEGSNVLIFDEPTDHLDMEAITALNNGMVKFPGTMLFACRDHQVVQTTANRIIEFMPDGTIIDKVTTYDAYLESDEMARKRQVYSMSESDAADN